MTFFKSIPERTDFFVQNLSTWFRFSLQVDLSILQVIDIPDVTPACENGQMIILGLDWQLKRRDQQPWHQCRIICGAIEESRRSLEAIDERIFINFCNKNAIFTNFCEKKPYLQVFGKKWFVWNPSRRQPGSKLDRTQHQNWLISLAID